MNFIPLSDMESVAFQINGSHFIRCIMVDAEGWHYFTPYWA